MLVLVYIGAPDGLRSSPPTERIGDKTIFRRGDVFVQRAKLAWGFIVDQRRPSLSAMPCYHVLPRARARGCKRVQRPPA